MRKAGKPVPEYLLPKSEAKTEDEMAAVAVALDMYYGTGAQARVAGQPACSMLNDGRRHATEWNRKIYGMNNLM